MRVLILLVVYALSLGAAMGQAPVGLVSSVESGWTSNATESAGGAADFYLRHSHDLSARGAMGPLSLRAGLMVEQQVFRQHDGENDLSITGGAEAGLALFESMRLRTGYALTGEWTGKMLDLGPVMLSINSPALVHEILGELIVGDTGKAITMGMDLRHRQPGPSGFAGLPIAPMVIDPEVREVTARVDGEWAIGQEAVGLARLHWIVASVPEADRFDFGREPASVARLAGGLRLRQGLLSVEARAGGDLVWPEAAPHLTQFWPYLDAKAEMAVTEQLTISARAFAGVELFSPLDGVANRRLEADLDAGFALTDRIVVSAGLGLSHERGLYDDSVMKTNRTVRGAVSHSFASGMEAGIKASHAQVEETGAAYEVSTIGLTLAGKV